MDVGMLWFDNDNKTDLPTKVNQAATYYQGKYGVHPNVCFIHPSMANIGEAAKSKPKVYKTGEIEVRLTKSVLPHHFWIGIHHQEAEKIR